MVNSPKAAEAQPFVQILRCETGIRCRAGQYGPPARLIEPAGYVTGTAALCHGGLAVGERRLCHGGVTCKARASG
jgi:hypothetical protein